MDIKGLNKIHNPFLTNKVGKIEKGIVTDNATEREGNGQAATGGDSGQHEPMSEEEFQCALEHLKKHSIFKEHNLEIQITLNGNKRIVILLEPSGKILRRITETELRTLQLSKENEKGQLLSKSA